MWGNGLGRQKLQELLQGISGALFPPRCIVCGGVMEAEDGQLHGKCGEKLYPVMEPVCMHCGRPLLSDTDEFCYDCSRQRRVSFSQGKALYLYAGDIKKTMYRFKYANKREYGRFFAAKSFEQYGGWIRAAGIEVIVPVPMYRKKERRRGYNQAYVFAKELSLLCGLPVRKLVKRVKDTRPQKELGGAERKNNLKNAFQTGENIVEYKRVLLVDDIYTTGSTADAVADTLLAAGAEEVYFLSICIGKGV